MMGSDYEKKTWTPQDGPNNPGQPRKPSTPEPVAEPPKPTPDKK